MPPDLLNEVVYLPQLTSFYPIIMTQPHRAMTESIHQDKYVSLGSDLA